MAGLQPLPLKVSITEENRCLNYEYMKEGWHLSVSVVRDGAWYCRLLEIGTTCTARAKYKEAKFQGFKILLQGRNADLTMPEEKDFTEESRNCFLAARLMGKDQAP